MELCTERKSANKIEGFRFTSLTNKKRTCNLEISYPQTISGFKFDWSWSRRKSRI